MVPLRLERRFPFVSIVSFMNFKFESNCLLSCLKLRAMCFRLPLFNAYVLVAMLVSVVVSCLNLNCYRFLVA